MVLSHVPRKLIRNALRVWQDILLSDTQYGVFVISSELKAFAVVGGEMQRHLDQMIDDLPNHFVGLFDRHGDYQQFLSDVAITANQLATMRFDDDD